MSGIYSKPELSGFAVQAANNKATMEICANALNFTFI